MAKYKKKIALGEQCVSSVINYKSRVFWSYNLIPRTNGWFEAQCDDVLGEGVSFTPRKGLFNKPSPPLFFFFKVFLSFGLCHGLKVCWSALSSASFRYMPNANEHIVSLNAQKCYLASLAVS